MTTDKYTKIDKSRACLILGAIGDSLGAPVEFMKMSEIVEKYGDKGIVRLDQAYSKPGAVTDDTQMTLFTADSLINAHKRGKDRGILGEYWTYTAFGYANWAKTQGGGHPNKSDLKISRRSNALPRL